MAEATKIETETEHSPDEAVQMLRDLADEIASGDEITVEGNNATMTVLGTVEKISTEVEAEREIKGEYDQVEVEIEFEWAIIPEHDENDSEE